MILWGPPGCGKTTIARLLAGHSDLAFEPLSAVFSGVADLRKVFERGPRSAAGAGQGTLLFVDEIHRFNRAQQDGFLPYVEDGTVILVGATTENPSFELNPALLSRCPGLRAEPPGRRGAGGAAAPGPRRGGRPAPCRGPDDARRGADRHGRRRRPLPAQPDRGAVRPAAGRAAGPAGLAGRAKARAALRQGSQEGHYNLISALHKSLRGSDTDAALYWLARMLVGRRGPELRRPRRLTRFAVEDIGLADPQALVQASAGLAGLRAPGHAGGRTGPGPSR